MIPAKARLRHFLGISDSSERRVRPCVYHGRVLVMRKQSGWQLRRILTNSPEEASQKGAANFAAPSNSRNCKRVYFGHPRLATGSELAAWEFVTDAGIWPPLGMNHTTTRRISASGPAGTDD